MYKQYARHWGYKDESGMTLIVLLCGLVVTAGCISSSQSCISDDDSSTVFFNPDMSIWVKKHCKAF